MSSGVNTLGCSNVQLSINQIGSYASETSTWAFSDVVIWDRVLSAVDMKKVSDAMLLGLCGTGYHMSSLRVCTACPTDAFSTGTNCICSNANYYISGSSCVPYFSSGLSAIPWGIWRAESYSATDLRLKESRGYIKKDMIQGGGGTISSATASGNGALNLVTHIKGGTSSTLKLTMSLSSYTMCAITRYDGSNRGRILTDDGTANILLGHYNGKKGLAHFGFWLTEGTGFAGPGSALDWLVICGQNGNSAPNNILANGISSTCYKFQNI